MLAYAAELFQFSIKLDATRGSEIARLLVDLTGNMPAAKIRAHAEGVLRLSSDSQLPAEIRAAMEKVR